MLVALPGFALISYVKYGAGMGDCLAEKGC
jgi:hypothetical protein